MRERYLHIGASRLEKFTKESLEVFLTKDWIHLWDAKLNNPNNKELIEVDYSKTNFIPFHYQKGDELPFENNYFSFAYSEHFFEHLFFDEAIELFKELYRVLKPNSILRIVVPDADLKPISEKLGFFDENIKYHEPTKHKTRWSVYNLKAVLEVTNFQALSLRYFDKFGTRHSCSFDNLPNVYPICNAIKLIYSEKIIKRENSLIIDGIKR